MKKCKVEAAVEAQGVQEPQITPVFPSIDLDDPTLTTFDDSDRPVTPDPDIPLVQVAFSEPLYVIYLFTIMYVSDCH